MCESNLRQWENKVLLFLNTIHPSCPRWRGGMDRSPSTLKSIFWQLKQTYQILTDMIYNSIKKDIALFFVNCYQFNHNSQKFCQFVVVVGFTGLKMFV